MAPSSSLSFSSFRHCCILHSFLSSTRESQPASDAQLLLLLSGDRIDFVIDDFDIARLFVECLALSSVLPVKSPSHP